MSARHPFLVAWDAEADRLREEWDYQAVEAKQRALVQEIRWPMGAQSYRLEHRCHHCRCFATLEREHEKLTEDHAKVVAELDALQRLWLKREPYTWSQP